MKEIALLLDQKGLRMADHALTLEAAQRRIQELELTNQALHKKITHLENQDTNLIQRIVEALPVPVFWKDTQSIYMGCNRLYAQDMGLNEPDEIIGKSDFDLAHTPEQAQAFRRDDLDVMQKRSQKVNYEENVSTVQGLRWVQTNKLPLLDEKGQVIGVIGAYVDISERKAVNEALKQSKTFLQFVLDNIPARVFWKDRDSVFLGCNRLFAQDLDLAHPDDIIGQTDFDIFSTAEYAAVYREDDQAVMTKGQSLLNYQEMLRMPDGMRWIEISKVPLLNGDDEIVGVIGTYRDIHEQKMLTEALKQSRSFLQFVLDNIPARVFWKNQDCVYLGCNSLFALDAGVPSPEHIIGKTDFDLAFTEAEAAAFRNDDIAVISTEVSKLHFEEPQTTPTGLQWLETSKVPLKSETGEVIGVLGTYTDITARKHVEQQREDLLKELEHLNQELEQRVQERTRDFEIAKLEAENANKVKSAFLSSMSHELRTPLNAIINFSKFLKMEIPGPVNAEQAHLVSSIARSGQHLLNLINDVLDMSKIESGELKLYIEENIDMLELINTSVLYTRNLLDGKSVTMEASIEGTLPRMNGDRKRLLQILLNILSNACKFTETGFVWIRAQANDHTLEISVQDTGPGISQEDTEHVFVAFRQTENGLRQAGSGTGLGLPISKRLVEAHHGKIWFESELNKGTTFFVALPIHSDMKPRR
ncbi:hypothetical protein MASR2M15_18460 [Anaerolineales bacterium]